MGDLSYVNHLKRYGVARILGMLPAPRMNVPMEIHLREAAVGVRFDTRPDRRYTVDASADLVTWDAWVSGEFTYRSVAIPIPVQFFGATQYFRASATDGGAN